MMPVSASSVFLANSSKEAPTRPSEEACADRGWKRAAGLDWRPTASAMA